MKAIVQDTYGPPDVLQAREIAEPKIGPAEVLVRVHAASVRIGVCFAVRGSPLLVRASTGLRRPKSPVPGFDLAGEVGAVGAAVTRLKPGDRVFGAGTGAYAEYAKAPAEHLVAIPAGLSYEEAAAIPTSALAALHGLRDAAELKTGHHVLINGASGGVGTYAVQIAKALGAEVTAVVGPTNVDLMRQIGADHVIDYTRDDFTRSPGRYDAILDNIENHSLRATRAALTPGGTLVLNSGTGARGLRLLLRLIVPLILSPFGSRKMRRYLSNPRQPDLEELARLADEGKLRPVIGRTFPLDETAEALRHVEAGHARGNVVIGIAAL